ncbi:hypothetical protein RB195_002193 [Necator americanus]
MHIISEQNGSENLILLGLARKKTAVKAVVNSFKGAEDETFSLFSSLIDRSKSKLRRFWKFPSTKKTKIGALELREITIKKNCIFCFKMNSETC